MARFLGVLLGLWLWVGPAAAQDNAAIESVIDNQLRAFNERDIGAAWQYASPLIKRLFENEQNFGAMVERGYPMVWTNSNTRFLELEEIGGRMIQRVLISDAKGVPHVLVYEMIQAGGKWVINGVSVLPAPDVGA